MQWWVAGNGGGHQCPAPVTCIAYPSGCAVLVDGACAQTLVPWVAIQSQLEQRHVARKGGTLPARASSWCSRDGVLTRLAGKVQRPARDQIISPFWGKWRAGHGSNWRGVTGHPRCCWCVRKEGRVQHGWNWPLLAFLSRQLANDPLARRPKDQQGAHHSCHLCKLGQQREDSVDDHRQTFESMLFQGYQPRYIGRSLSRQCKGVDDLERLSTLAAGLWSPDARSPSPPFVGQLPRPHPLGEVCGDECGPLQHPRFLPAAKHDLGSPTLRCWIIRTFKRIIESDLTTYFWMATRTTLTIRKKSAFWMRSA